MAIFITNFALPRLLPGSPIKTLAGESVGELTEDERNEILATYHLDKPLAEQFAIYVKDFFTLNWGTSFSKRESTVVVIMRALPWTVLLSVSNLVISTMVGCYFGLKSALKRKTQKDKSYIVVISILSSIPTFWLGMTLLAFFGVKLNWFPIGNASSLWADYHGVRFIIDVLHHLILPLTAMVLTTLTTFFIATRNGTLKVISENYVELAKFRNIPKRKIKYQYILRNALIPVFTIFMVELGFVFSGSIVIESIFSYPGIGSIMHNAVLSRDYPLVQYSFLVVSLMVVFASFLSDVCMKYIDREVM